MFSELLKSSYYITFFIKWIQGCFAKSSLVNLPNKCYDRFPSFLESWSTERNTENTMSDLYLMEKVVILKKRQTTIKTFPPPFFNHFSLNLNRIKTCGNESHEKETKIIYALATNLLHIKIGNVNWCKCAHCKNERKK